MRPPELAGINLNSLVTLDTLLATRSVGASARRLGLTPSAVSHALRHLRALLDDPLLVRAGNRMRLTPRAEALRVPLRNGLLEIEAAITQRAAFDPATSERRLRVAASDGIAVSLLGPLLRRLLVQAPHMDLDLVPLDRSRMAGDLEAGAIDVAFVPGSDPGQGLRQQTVRRTDFVVLVWEDHPEVGESMDLDQYCALPHALISSPAGGPGLVDEVLGGFGRRRRVAVRFPYALAAPAVLVGTRLVLTCPRGPAMHFAQTSAVRVLEPPLELPTGTLAIVWHERFDRAPALRWFRALVLEVSAEVAASWNA
ncbi:MAG: LysR family transcriptional regulator [Myxococcota bacterium]